MSIIPRLYGLRWQIKYNWGIMRVTVESIENVVLETLGKVGVDRKDCFVILDTILFANKRGVATHGVGRLPLYVEKIKAGHLNPKNEMQILFDLEATALMDARNGFGQIAAYKAVTLAIAKAKKYGISVVGVRNSNNFGTAGYFGDLAARVNCAALIFANAAPAIAPSGGNKMIFGTNPLCFAFPGSGKHDPILLDMATTVAARGKIRLAAKNGEKIPLDWALGPDGKPTDDPNVALQGSLLPIGGYKGYGISFFVDIFAGLLSGSSYGGKVKNLNKMNENSGNGHLFIIIDVEKFMSIEEKDNRIEYLYRAVKDCGEPGKVFVPGEIEYNRLYQNAVSVEISEKQIEEINKTAASVGVDSRLIYE